MATKAKRDRLKRMQTREPYKYAKKDRLKAQQIRSALKGARSLKEDEPDLHRTRNHYLSEMV